MAKLRCPKPDCNYYVTDASPDFTGFCIVHGSFIYAKQYALIHGLGEMEILMFKFLDETPTPTSFFEQLLYGSTSLKHRKYVSAVGIRLRNKNIGVKGNTKNGWWIDMQEHYLQTVHTMNEEPSEEND